MSIAFFKLINRILLELNQANFSECGAWIKTLNLALKTSVGFCKAQNITLYKCVSYPGFDVYETYKKKKVICFPVCLLASSNENLAKDSIGKCYQNILFQIDLTFPDITSNLILKIV